MRPHGLAVDPTNGDVWIAYAWQGAYATPDSGRHQVEIQQPVVADDGLSVVLPVNRLQENYVYEVTCGKIGPDAAAPLWPATGHYTMNQVPKK